MLLFWDLANTGWPPFLQFWPNLETLFAIVHMKNHLVHKKYIVSCDIT